MEIHCVKSVRVWSYSGPLFSRIWTEYGEILECGPNSVEMLENADQKNPDYEHFLRSDRLKISRKKIGL